MRQSGIEASGAPSDTASLEWCRSRWTEPDPDGGTRRDGIRRLLEARRGSPEAAGEPLDLRGLELREADLRGIDLSRADLRGADLQGTDLGEAVLFGADLEGAILHSARLEGAELTGARLRGADLRETKAARAGFGGADLRDARLAQAALRGATLTNADLRGADLRNADLAGARLREAKLDGADLTAAAGGGADFEAASVPGAAFRDADLRGARFRGLRGYQKATWIGADFRDADFTGAWLFRRFALDQNFLDEFRRRDRWSAAVYWVWWATSDCGRSLLRWGLLTVTLTVVFAFLYTLVGIDFGRYETPLSPLYYSVVTVSTLGYGDVVPSTLGGQVVAMFEVAAGYVMLGGLVTIFSNKLGRRAD